MRRAYWPWWLCMAGLSCAASHAAQPLVLAFDELMPWKTVDGERHGGAYTEIVRELARRVQLPLRITNCPLKRCVLLLEQGEADIVIGIKDTPERRQFIHFLRTPYRDSSSDKVFYVLKSKGTTLASYADLTTLRIGVKLGAEYFAPFDKDSTLKKDAIRDAETNFRKLQLGRIDAVLVPEDQGEAMVARLHLGAVVEKAPYRIADPSSRSVGIGKHSPYADKLDAFERAMAAMAKDGTLKALIRRYYYDAYQVPLDSVQIR
jgi:polar amino acid transport system substrate-binding protein